jgi:hypothetical protein
MGSPMAVTYASIYLTIVELEIFAVCRQSLDFRIPLLYLRFIDGLFYISSNKLDILLFFTTFDGFHPSIRLTSDINSASGVFFDIEAFKGPQFLACGLLDIRLYQKPINSYLYIPPTSFHHPSVFTSFISAEIRRYRLLCSQDSDFRTMLTLFYDRLLARGYQVNLLIPLFSTLPNRDNLLHQILHGARNPSADSFPPLTFSIPFSYRTSRLHLHRALRIPPYLRATTLFDMVMPAQSHPSVCFRRAPNLRVVLVSSAYPHTIVLTHSLPVTTDLKPHPAHPIIFEHFLSSTPYACSPSI